MPFKQQPKAGVTWPLAPLVEMTELGDISAAAQSLNDALYQAGSPESEAEQEDPGVYPLEEAKGSRWRIEDKIRIMQIEEAYPEWTCEQKYEKYNLVVLRPETRSYLGFCKQRHKLVASQETVAKLKAKRPREKPSKRPLLGPHEEPDWSLVALASQNFVGGYTLAHNKAIWRFWTDPALRSTAAKTEAYFTACPDSERTGKALQSRFSWMRTLPVKPSSP